MTLFDKIVLYAFASAFFTLTFYTLFKNLAAAILASVLLVVAVRAVWLRLYVRRRKKEIGVGEMENALAMMGNEQAGYFLSVVPQAYAPELRESGIVYFDGKKKVYLFPNYKFSATGRDDVARFYRAAKKEKVDVCYVLGRQPDRQTYLLSNSLDILFTFIPSKKLHKFLASQNALMPKPRRVKNPKRPSFKHLLDEAFTKKRAKYFALSGLSVTLLGFFVPFRAYYFVFGGLSLLLSIACLVRKEN